MATIYGTENDDRLTGTAGDDFMHGGGGDDILWGLGGNDRLASTEGMDILDGGAGDDIIDSDYVDGDVDTLTGGAGADRFIFNVNAGTSRLAAVDRITDFSSAGGDRLDIGVMNGNLGGLRYLRWSGAITTPGFTLTIGQSLANSADGLVDVWTWTNAGSTWLIVDRNDNETLDANDLVIAFTGTPALGVEAFVAGTFTAGSGTLGGDSFSGGAAPDIYFALDGDDTASGGGGDDEVFGGDGGDILTGGDGNDLLAGELGNDVLRGGGGDDRLYAGMHLTSHLRDTGTTNELYGEAGDDSLMGRGGRDLLDGGAGADVLSSRDDDTAAGGDTLLGGDGNDVLNFNGDQLADGGAGDDLFYFGEFASTVTGGLGADRFDLIQTGSQGNFESGQFHLITDFNQAEGDLFNFGLPGYYRQPLIFRGALDNPAFSQQAGQSFSSSDYGSDLAQIWTWASDGETFMMVDLDGSGALSDADYVVRLEGSVSLTAGAFVTGTVITNPGGTAGADVLQSTGESDVIYGLSGDDIINASAGNDYLYGNAGDDEIFGGAGSNHIYGGDGDDVLNGGAGYGVIHGGSGSDIIHGGQAGGELHAGGNNLGDRDGPEDFNLIYGSDAIDRIYGGYGPLDQSFGYGGNDIISGGGLIDGGAGDDQLSSSGALAPTTLIGGAGADTINSGEMGDLLIGGAGEDSLQGGGGADELMGGFGDQGLYGGAGDDILRISGPAGTDDPALHLSGAEGFDLADFSEAGAILTLDLGTVNQQETGVGSVFISEIEHVIATMAGSHITGSEFDERLQGLAGEDSLLGQAGDDFLSGGLGDDILDGGLGNDRIDGGGGEDVLVVTGAAADYRLLMDGDDFILKGPDGRDHLTGIETIRFGDGSELELNRMYASGGPGTDGAIPDHLLSTPLEDAFVLPVMPDVRPLVLPGLGSDKGAEPLVLPGPTEVASLFPEVAARLLAGEGWVLNMEHGVFTHEPACRVDDLFG